MSQSLSKVILHLIFSTKNRENYIKPELLPSLHAYMATLLRDMESNALRVGGTTNHIHIACTLPRTVTQSELLKKLKIESSKWLKGQGLTLFSWQRGYGSFSVAQSQLSVLVKYIDNQEVHHKQRTFQEEYLDFLKRYDVPYDERYVWD